MLQAVTCKIISPCFCIDRIVTTLVTNVNKLEEELYAIFEYYRHNSLIGDFFFNTVPPPPFPSVLTVRFKPVDPYYSNTNVPSIKSIHTLRRDLLNIIDKYEYDPNSCNSYL